MKALIALPAYNEEAGIEQLLQKIDHYRQISAYPIQVLVVDDGSIDGTKEVVRRLALTQEGLRLIEHPANKGLGEAVKTIFNYAETHLQDQDVLVTMDADNTHPPFLIESMIERLYRERLDLVVASRFTPGGCELGLKALRKFYSRAAMIFFKIFFPIRNVNDYSSGFRAYRVGALKEARLHWKDLITTNGFDCMAEIAAKLSRLNVQAAEVPLILRYELKAGASKMKVGKTIKGYFSLLGKVR